MKKYITPLLFASLILVGCKPLEFPRSNNNTQPPISTTPTQPRNDIVCTQEYRYGLTVYLKDEKGNPIEGARIYVIAQEKGRKDTLDFGQIGSPGSYAGLGEGEGKYTVRIEKAGFKSQNLSVDLEHDECHVDPKNREITLEPLN